MHNMIKNFVRNMSYGDFTKFIENKNINATEEEKKIVFEHIKKYYVVFFDNPIYYIKLLKGKISDENYYQILMVFDQYKHFL